MTIKEYILEKEVAHTEERLEKLKEIGAPEIVISNLRKELERMKSGDIKIGGDNKLLDEAFESREIKKGNGGKVYIQFDGRINYFPNAQYGRFIAVNNR